MSDCVEWVLSKDRDGYGQVWVNGKLRKAHRQAYCTANNLEYSEIKGKLIRHTCDNPSCVNPLHLIIGTHRDNMKDRADRNRTAKGEDHGNVKLTKGQVELIRLTYTRGCRKFGCPALARKYGVTFQTIHKIVTHQRW